MNSDSSHIMNVLSNTFCVLKEVYDNHKEGQIEWKDNSQSRIIFPKYAKHRGNKTRLSEQELRFILIEQLNKYCDENKDWHILYSVETPTEKRYRFSSKYDESDLPKEDPSGQSASTDLTIHDSQGNRICLIEFKAHDPQLSCYLKDFLKLSVEVPIVPKNKECLKLFVQVLENEPLGNIQNKLNDPSLKEKISEYGIGDKVHYHIFSLADNDHGSHYIGKTEDGRVVFNEVK